MAEMSAKEAVEILEKEIGYATAVNESIKAVLVKPNVIDAERYALSLCRKLASGELREVVHGHWNHTSRPNEDCMGGSHDVIECSVCNEDYDSEYDFCPSCGNPMDGKDGGHTAAENTPSSAGKAHRDADGEAGT